MGFENASPDNFKVDLKTSLDKGEAWSPDIAMPDSGKDPGEVRDLLDRGGNDKGSIVGMDGKLQDLPKTDGPNKNGTESNLQNLPKTDGPNKDGLNANIQDLGKIKATALPDDDGSKLNSRPGVVSDIVAPRPEQKEGPAEAKPAAPAAEAIANETQEIRSEVDAVRGFLDGIKTSGDWNEDARTEVSLLASLGKRAKELMGKATTDAEKAGIAALTADIENLGTQFVEHMKAVEAKAQAEGEKKAGDAIDGRTDGPTGDAPTPGPSEKPSPTEPKKTGMERMADGLGKAIEKIVEFFGKLSEAISNALDKAGVNKKNMLKVFGNVPVIGDVLRSKIQVDDIHAQIEKTFGKGKLLKTDKDSEASSDLKKAFDSEAKPAGSTENFEQFVQKRIDAVKATGKTDKITIEDLVNVTPVAAKPADAKPDETKPDEKKPAEGEKGAPDALVQKIQDEAKRLGAEAKETQPGVWRVELDMGMGKGKTPLTFIEFRKKDGAWQFRDSSTVAVDGPDFWYADKPRFPLNDGTAGKALDNRTAMNQLLNALQGAPEDPEKQKETRKTNYMKAFASAFNNASGEARTDLNIVETDDWKSIGNKIKTALANETFDIANIKLELDGNTLEATDTSSGGFGMTDKNLIDNWADLATNPVLAIKQFMDISTVGLDAESANAINRIKDSMKAFLKNDMAAFDKDVTEATPAVATTTADFGGDNMGAFGSY